MTPESSIALLPIYLEPIFDTVVEPLVILSNEQRVLAANRSFYRNFAVAKEETEGRLIYELGNGQWNIPELRIGLEQIIHQHRTLDSFEVHHVFETIGEKIMRLNGRLIEHEKERIPLILLAIEDITERAKAFEQLKESEAKYHKFVEEISSIIIGFTPEGRITFFNHWAVSFPSWRIHETSPHSRTEKRN